MSRAGEIAAVAERCEAAEASGQHAMLEAAFSTIYPGLQLPHPGLYWPPLATRFVAMLDAEAYESAALTLVPEGVEGLPLSFKVEHFYRGNGIWLARASVWDGLGGVSSLDTATIAATPALALCAAAVRAHLKGTDDAQ